MNTTSSDFIISAELIAGHRTGVAGGGISPAALPYTGPFTLAHSTQVKVRALSDSVWSALNEAVFAVGPVQETLRVTEIMYHPEGVHDPNAEFIELQNVGTDAINLNGVRFTRGIDFEFPSLELLGGERILVARDVAAFTTAYGPDLYVVGPYTGTLSNSGEWVALEDARGESILDFRYNDSWYDTTDGEGASLTLVNPLEADPDHWNLKEAWRASTLDGGSPGWEETGQ